jgi:hypothetical protein
LFTDILEVKLSPVFCIEEPNVGGFSSSSTNGYQMPQPVTPQKKAIVKKRGQ